MTLLKLFLFGAELFYLLILLLQILFQCISLFLIHLTNRFAWLWGLANFWIGYALCIVLLDFIRSRFLRYFSLLGGQLHFGF